MKIIFVSVCFFLLFSCNNNSHQKNSTIINNSVHWDTLTLEYAQQMATMPLKCIFQEYPNKTAHTASDKEDILKTPSQLHPSFYGCFDWHSSVHGHWMLVRILNRFPNISLKDTIIYTLKNSLTADNIIAETAYFNENIAGAIFERTYGWAWLLKLDQELAMSLNKDIKTLHNNLQPLTQKIKDLWTAYLAKQSYPNKTGIHGNTAFALALAFDWATYNNDTKFLNAIKEKSLSFYGNMKHYPAHLEPDGADFFSPSLYTADLMSRILDVDAFNNWIDNFLEEDGVKNLCLIPTVSDRNDYQIVHLDGLMFSKVANMRKIIPLINDESLKLKLMKAQGNLLTEALKHLKSSNYGGEHWLASFAILALSGY